MKTQISRWSDNPAKRRSGIYQQQGRMLTDADLNELMELLKRRIDAAVGDVVGSGAPRTATLGLIQNGPAIKQATLYVDGIRARLEARGGDSPFSLSRQADFPEPPAYPGGEQVLYADVWEWPVTALQDASLLDPALHGADTATRTQTLAQVKWCPGTVDPMTDAKNPGKGDAVLTLTIREGSNEADPCDPCAAEIALEDRIGNYLFRVEIHDVKGPADAPSEVTVKWSSENGAEQHAQVNVPVDFTRGDWIYEFYSDITEKHLGVHLTPGFTPSRAVLMESWPPAAELPEPEVLPYVRRWDGYAVLAKAGSTWSIKSVAGVLQAKDKGRLFEPLPGGSTPTHGHFRFLAGRVLAELSALSLDLSLDGGKFVAGDFWLATVREDAEGSDRLQLVSSTPLGITHHYMVLAKANGATVQALSEADIRRLSFPKLTELTADRIGYSPAAQAARWTDVIDDNSIAAPLNVQRAIDLLIERLESSDIPFTVPACETNPSVRSLLGLAANSASRVDTMLTKLLCDFRATHLPLDKNATDLPPVLAAPSIVSVQQALGVLAGLLGTQGCEATVGPGGQYATLVDAFGALATATDVSLCLLPGVQSLPAGATLSGKRTIKITGAGAYASKVNLGGKLQLGGNEIILRDISVIGQQEAAHIVLQADRVIAKNNAFARATSFQSHRTSRRYGGTDFDQALSLAIDSAGNVLVTGHFFGTMNLGGQDLISGASSAVFAAKFTADGIHVWSKAFTGPRSSEGKAIAVDANNDVLITGSFRERIEFGTTTLPATPVNESAIFVAKLSGTTGVPIWAKGSTGAGPGNEGSAIAVDASGFVVVAGTFTGSINFGQSRTSTGGNDGFAVRFNSAGAHQWTIQLSGPSTGNSPARGIGCDASGNIYLTGSFNASVNIGGIQISAAGDGNDVFLAKLTSAGVGIWAKPLGGPSFESGRALAVDPAGNVWIAGLFDGTADLGGGALVGNLFVAKFNSTGAHVWSRGYNSAGFVDMGGIAVDANGNVAVTGQFTDSIFFGDVIHFRLGTQGEHDLFVLKLDVQGNHVWSRAYGAVSADIGTSIKVHPSGDLVFTGNYQGTLNFGGEDLVSSEDSLDFFIARLTPEPVLNPFVTIRPRDPNRGSDLVWSQNDMLVTVSDDGATPQPRTALALATPNIGGAIIDNTIEGRVLLQSDLPFDVMNPVVVAAGVTSIGGGAYLTIRGNHVARINSRYETGAPNLDTLGSLIITDNTVIEPNNSFIAEAINLQDNQFRIQRNEENVGVMAARHTVIVGNQSVSTESMLSVASMNGASAANALTLNSMGTLNLQPNTSPVWYYGGVAADLLPV